jgi:hypothetical protein
MPFNGPRWHWPYIAITTGIMILTVFYAVANEAEDVAVVLFIVFVEALFAVMLYAVGRSIEEEWKEIKGKHERLSVHEAEARQAKVLTTANEARRRLAINIAQPTMIRSRGGE